MASMVDGRLRLPVGREKINHLAGSFDFVGVNYYSRYFLKPIWRGLGFDGYCLLMIRTNQNSALGIVLVGWYSFAMTKIGHV